MITVEQIEATQAFQSIKDQVTKTVILQKTTRGKINFGVTMSKESGIEQWQRVTSPTKNVFDIVKELTTEKGVIYFNENVKVEYVKGDAFSIEQARKKICELSEQESAV